MTIYEKTKTFVSTRYGSDFTGHGWDHINRVEKMALHICEKEGGNKQIVQLSVLLHDYIDDKLTDEDIALKEVKDFLVDLSISTNEVDHIIAIITQISFSKGINAEELTLEGKIVQDADRLDAIGAIGIARTLTYGGAKNRVLYDPKVTPRTNMSKEEYRSGDSTTINHFYEKLLLLKDQMNTDTAKDMARKRHNVMKDFLEQFIKEWNSEDF